MGRWASRAGPADTSGVGIIPPLAWSGHQEAAVNLVAIVDLMPGAAITGHGAAITGGQLRGLVDRLQMAPAGSDVLDALIDDALSNIRKAFHNGPRGGFARMGGNGWSNNLGAALAALPDNYNFSVGQRDGICWAWLQPNDDWQPGEFQSRHDHPGGSGLVVAYTAALALICAALLLYAGLLESGAAPHGRPEFT